MTIPGMPASRRWLDRIAWLVMAFMPYPTSLWAQAQIPPGAGYVYPPVIKIGTTTDVVLGGFDWTDDMEWFVHRKDVHLETVGLPGDYLLTPPPYWMGPRAITAAFPVPREVPGRIRVDANAAPGLVHWQVANANGGSSAAVFCVSDTDEILESRSRDLPQRLPRLPLGVSGRLSRLTEVDRYEVMATKDGLMSVDLLARRLGSKLNGQVEVRESSGRLVADFADTVGHDGSLTFAAKSGEMYSVALHDVDFRGDRSFVYRLQFSEGPRVTAIVPSRGMRGDSTEREFVGYGLATGAASLESVRDTVSIPADPTLSEHRHSLATPSGVFQVPLPVGDVREIHAASIPSTPEGVLPIQPPVAVTGRLDVTQREVRHAWESPAKGSWAIALQAQAIGSPLDLCLKVYDPEGKLIARSDDPESDPEGSLAIAAVQGGRYTAVVRSLSPVTGSPDEFYRLEVRPLAPDFELRVPQTIAVPLGGQSAVKLTVRRTGGFAGPITIRPEGLPRGVATSGTWMIPEGQSEVSATLEAAPDADVVAGMIRLRGTATIDGREVDREAFAPLTGMLGPAPISETHTSQILLAVTMPPPFELKVPDRERQREVHRGTTYLAELELVRQEGFQGAMQVAMSAKQDRDRQGVRGPLLSVPDGAHQIVYPVTMPEWLSTDLTRRIVVHGVGAVPDPKGRLRFLTRAADARITMILEGALLKVACLAEEPTLRPGDQLVIPVSISRSVKLPLATTVELVVPTEIAGMIEASPMTLPVGQDQGDLRIVTRNDPKLNGAWRLELRATALQEGRWPVISVTEFPLVFQDK